MSAARDPPPASTQETGLQKAKTNLTYLALGSGAAAAPSSLATRSFLTTTRYVLRYIIRRLIRYAKYAAVGGVAALLGGTVLGTMGSGLAFFAAPGLLGGMGLGLAGGLAKFGWRHRGNYFRDGIWDWEGAKKAAAEGRDGAADEKVDNQRAKQTKGDVWMRA